MKDIELDDYFNGVGREMCALKGFVILLQRLHNPRWPLEVKELELVSATAEVVVTALETKLDIIDDQIRANQENAA